MAQLVNRRSMPVVPKFGAVRAAVASTIETEAARRLLSRRQGFTYCKRRDATCPSIQLPSTLHMCLHTRLRTVPRVSPPTEHHSCRRTSVKATFSSDYYAGVNG